MGNPPHRGGPAMTHVAVLMGGWSSERGISLVSGKAVVDALDSLGMTVTAVDVDRNIAAALSDLKPDVAFNALHGPWGEDGCVQGVLETLGIAYTHSGVMASAIRSEEHTSELQSLMCISYAVFCLKKKY